MIKVFTDGFKIIQGFGKENTSPKFLPLYIANGLDGHEGVDIVPLNKIMDWRIFSLFDGTVVRVSNICDNPYGRYVTIWSKKLNFALQYCHMASVKVAIGDKIKAGNYIGEMGGSGTFDGQFDPHTHINKIPVNMFGYRNGNKKNGYKGLVDPTPDLLA